MESRFGVGLAGCATIVLLLMGCSRPTQVVSVELWHCGISPLTVHGRTWEVSDPPFDAASTLPPGFSGRGTATVQGETLRYVDDRGFRLIFLPAEDVPPPPPCA